MYAIDLHTHTRFFHAWPGRPTRYDPTGRSLNGVAARLRGLDGTAVTNHNYTYSAEGRFPTIPGVEMSTTLGHVVVVGPDPPSRPERRELTPAEAVDVAHDRDCAAILAHPYRNSAARDSGAEFDAIEVNGKNPEHVEQTVELAERLDLPLVGGSDAHYPFEVGRAYTEIDARRLTPDAVVAAIREARVEPVVALGRFHRILDRAYNHIHDHKARRRAEA